MSGRATPMARAPDRGPDEQTPSVRRALVVAAVVVLAVRHIVPFGGLVLYPFTLLGTWVHEMGHGVTALIVGGTFLSLDIFRDASGLAHMTAPRGFPSALVAIGGLLAPPLAGASILVLARGPRRSRVVLLALAAALVLSLALWVRTLAGWVAMPLVAALVAAFALWGSPRERLVFAQFIGLLLGLDTIARIDYLFTATATVNGREQPSDIAAVVAEMGSVIPVWGALVALVGLSALYLALRVAWRTTAPTPRAP